MFELLVLVTILRNRNSGPFRCMSVTCHSASGQKSRPPSEGNPRLWRVLPRPCKFKVVSVGYFHIQMLYSYVVFSDITTLSSLNGMA